ncbi:MAG: hypothetical protein ACJ79H_10065 [Myxococcales bacterium]
MADPWRIAFPVLRDPWSQQECLITRKQNIADARTGVPPTMCEVTGRTRAGRSLRFTVPIADFDRASLSPVHLFQVETMRAPVGTLVDPTGKPLLAPAP